MEDKRADQDIKDVIAEETRRGRGRAPIDAEQKRKKRELGKGALRAIQFRDERAFGEQLRRAGIREG